MSDQIPIDNLDAGDDSPKLARASLKDVVVAFNRLSYTFKTPDDFVAPDALQLGADGNLALGGPSVAMTASGRNFAVLNNDAGGNNPAASNIIVSSASGTSYLQLKTAAGLSGVLYWDGVTPSNPTIKQYWNPGDRIWRHQTYNASGSTFSTALKIDDSSKIGITEGSTLQTLLNVGTVGIAGNEIWVASNTTSFEGVFLGAYDGRSGAKLDLNSQANATNVSSWRLSHDFNDGGQGKLSFRFAAAQTSRAGLTYAERFGLLNTNVLIGGGASRNVGGAVRYVQLEHTGQASMSMVRDSADTVGPALIFGKSRATAVGGNTVVQAGDELGNIAWSGANGTDMALQSAAINVYAAGTPSSTTIPAQMVFSTAKQGDGVTTEAMRITSQQNLSIGGASDVARLVMIKGVSYPSGEAMIYMQSSANAAIPVLICGSSSGTTSISGGSPLPAGGARGGQIDLIGGGASVRPGNVIIRTGTNADGLPGSNTFTYNASGMFGVNTLNPLHRFYAAGNTAERIRVMLDTFAEYSGFTGRRANGTAAAPTKVLAADGLVFLNAHGYTGTQYTNGGQITIQAEQDWSDTNTPSSIYLAPGQTGSAGQVNRFVVTSGGKMGLNNMTPAAIMTVTSPNSATGIGFEVDPDPTTSFVQFRSYDRTASNYMGWAQAASQFLWGVGTNTASTIMALTSSGNLTVGGTLARGGSGITAIEGNLILQAATNTTALFIQNGENYSGFKIKVGPTTQSNGGPDYFDFTTRPGNSGVGSNSDYVMIRMESAVSKSNPDMYLQTSGAGGRVVIGGTATSNTSRLNVVAMTGGSSVASFTGNTTTSVLADLVVSRSGVASTGAGRGSSLQLSNGTNNTHILLQESANGLQLFNYVNSIWAERMFMADTGRFIFGAHSSAAGNSADVIQVVGGLSGGNEYCYFAQANTGSQAFAMRMFSTTANATVGSITFTGSATSFNTTSDRRLKENIVDSPSARDMIDAIQVRSFNFKTDQSFWKYAFIAQELYNVAPFAVTPGCKDQEEFCPINNLWSVDNSKLVPAIIKAHQEVSKELKDTKQQLVQSQGELLALKTQMADILARLDRLENN